MLIAKEPARARRALDAALAAAPGMALAHMGRGRALLELQEVKAAITGLERAVSLDAKVGAHDPHYRLGVAQQRKGERGKTAAAFEQFLSNRPTGPGSDDARTRLAVLGAG